VDDLIRYLGPRVMVCDYDDVAVFDRCIERAFASTDPMAIVDVRVSLEGPTLRVEFGDGMHAVVAWDRLALNEVEPRLRPETAAVGQSSFSIEVLNEEGEVFEIDSMVVRALDDASLAQQIADVAESARRELGARLRGKREERGVTQQELAKLTGQQQSLLSKLENGRHQPTYATLEKYAAGLKLSVPELLG
jgi:DNA-binding XRE family transcriptional regulator